MDAHSSHVRAMYGVTFVGVQSEQILSFLPFALYSVLGNIRPRYIDSLLYHTEPRAMKDNLRCVSQLQQTLYVASPVL